MTLLDFETPLCQILKMSSLGDTFIGKNTFGVFIINLKKMTNLPPPLD